MGLNWLETRVCAVCLIIPICREANSAVLLLSSYQLSVTDCRNLWAHVCSRRHVPECVTPAATPPCYLLGRGKKKQTNKNTGHARRPSCVCIADNIATRSVFSLVSSSQEEIRNKESEEVHKALHSINGYLIRSNYFNYYVLQTARTDYRGAISGNLARAHTVFLQRLEDSAIKKILLSLEHPRPDTSWTTSKLRWERWSVAQTVFRNRQKSSSLMTWIQREIFLAWGTV